MGVSISGESCEINIPTHRGEEEFYSRQVHHHVILKGHDIHVYVKSSVQLVRNTHI